MFKPHKNKVACAGAHRSGWDFVREHLAAVTSVDGSVILDDFVERTFLYDSAWHNEAIYREPWVGISHHAPDIPSWYLSRLQLWSMVQTYRWQQSLSNLRLMIALSPNTAQWYSTQYPELPVVCLKHPSGPPLLKWSPQRFAACQKRLLQVGWFCRNTAAIYQVDAAAAGFVKVHLRQDTIRWIGVTEVQCQTYFRSSESNVGKTQILRGCDDLEYDKLLAESVIFMEVITAAANNTIIECIARNTPIVVNRHPGPSFYLGEDYPLFYSDIREVPKLLTEERVLSAYEYLRRLDKTWLLGEFFVDSVVAACERFVPEFITSCGVSSQSRMLQVV